MNRNGLSHVILVGMTISFTASLCCPEVFAEDNAAAEQSYDFAAKGFWQTTNGKPVDLSWEFVDGEIRLTKPRGGSGHIVTPPLPPNFELSWQWKINQRTNTGLKYRVRRFGKQAMGNQPLGVEYQIIDDKPSDRSKTSTASMYDLVAPSHAKRLKPAGEWNDAKIVANGHRLEHFLNRRFAEQYRLRRDHRSSAD